MNTEILLTHVLLPGAIAGVVLLAAWLPWRGVAREERGSRAERWVTSIAGGLLPTAAFLATFIMAEGWPEYPPASNWHRVAWIVLAGGLIGTLGAIWSGLRPGFLFTALLVGLATGALFRPLPSAAQPWLWMASVGTGVAILTAVLASPVRVNHGFLMPVALWAAMTGAAMVLIQSNQLKLMMLAASLAMVAGALVVTRLIVRRATVTRGACAVIAAALIVLLVLGRIYTYRELSLACFALPAAGPALLWVTALPPLQRRPKFAAAVGALIAFVFPVLAVVLTMTAPEEASSTYKYEY